MTEAAPDRARPHILLVEDSSVFREMQALLLRQAGYAVSLHENPHAALAAAGQQRFDLVVIDHELPEMNGQLFMHALRRIQPETAVVFVSGSLTLELAIQLSRQGVAGIFNKPANPKTLLEKIAEALARHAARDTAARLDSSSPFSSANRGASASPPTATVVPAAPGEPAPERPAYVPRFVLGASEAFRAFTHRLWNVRDFRTVLLLRGEAGSPFELFARDLAGISIFRHGPVMACDAHHFDPRGVIDVLAPSLLSTDAGTLIVTGVETFTSAQQTMLDSLITGRDVFLPFVRRFRLVLAATNALTDRVADGTFDQTLHDKISALSLPVPSLRAMQADIVINAQRILVAHREAGHPHAPVALAPGAAAWLLARDWPGNYEQLACTLSAAIDLTVGDELTLAALAAGGPREEVSPASIAGRDLSPSPSPAISAAMA